MAKLTVARARDSAGHGEGRGGVRNPREDEEREEEKSEVKA